MSRIKRMSWGKYFNSKQDIYLDKENCADQEVKYYRGNDYGQYIEACAMKGYCNDENHWFTGEDDDFVIINENEDASWLLYDCNWRMVKAYIERRLTGIDD